MQPNNRASILAHLICDVIAQDDDAVGLRAQTELSAGAQHAIGDMVVSLASRNFKATWQFRARKRDDDIVIQTEITSTANDALQLARAISLAYIYLAVADGLFELRKFLDLYHLADDQRTGALRNGSITFGFKTDAYESRVHISSGNVPARVLSAQDAGDPVLGNKH